MERYLRQEVYPRHRRPPGFYQDFYRAWGEPEIKQTIAREVAALSPAAKEMTDQPEEREP